MISHCIRFKSSIDIEEFIYGLFYISNISLDISSSCIQVLTMTSLFISSLKSFPLIVLCLRFNDRFSNMTYKIIYKYFIYLRNKWKFVCFNLKINILDLLSHLFNLKILIHVQKFIK